MGFLSNSKWMPLFITQLMTILMLIGSLHDNSRDIPWDDIFKLGVSAANTGFCGWAHVGIDVYLSS